MCYHTQSNVVVLYNCVPADTLVNVVNVNNSGGNLAFERKNHTKGDARTLCLRKEFQPSRESSARSDPARTDENSLKKGFSKSIFAHKRQLSETTRNRDWFICLQDASYNHFIRTGPYKSRAQRTTSRIHNSWPSTQNT